MRYKMPTTRAEDFIDFYREKKFFERLTLARIEAEIIEEGEAIKSLKEKGKELLQKYKISEKDRYDFDSLKEMHAFLKKINKKMKVKEDIEELLEHEKEHEEEARKSRYKTSFSCWLIKKEDGIGIATAICIPFYRVNSEIYERIAKAPKEPSFLDR